MALTPYYDPILGALRVSDANTGAIGESITGGTSGSVLFIGSAGLLAQDNPNFFWDATNHRLGLGTTTPAQLLDVRGSAIIGTSAARTTISTWSANFGTTNGVWIDMPTSGPSGIGNGGPGTSPWVAYASGPSEWFLGSVAGDICYRNTGTGSLLFGNSGISAIMQIKNDQVRISNLVVGSGTSISTFYTQWSGAAGMWIDMPTDGPTGIGNGGPGTNPWVAYAHGSGEWFVDASGGDICYRNSTSGKALRFGNSGNVTVMYVQGDKAFFNASTSSSARLNIVAGSAPSSPSDGDVWYDSSHMYGRVNGTNAQLDNQAVAVVDITGTTQAAAVNTKYYADNAGLVTITLPTTAVQGDQIFIRGKAAGGWKLAQNSGQTCHGASNTTTGVTGSIASQTRYDCVTLECITANTDFIILNTRGTLTIT